jgi:hypothetical protein
VKSLAVVTVLAACSPAWRVGAKRNSPSASNCPTIALVLADVGLAAIAFTKARDAYRGHDDDRVAVFSLAALGLLLGAHLAEATCDR